MPIPRKPLGKARLLTAKPVTTALIEADNAHRPDSNSQLNGCPVLVSTEKDRL